MERDKKSIIDKFYKTILGDKPFLTFMSITKERKAELDVIASKYHIYATNKYKSKYNILYFAAELLLTKVRDIPSLNNDEKGYIFINIVDPHLHFLETFYLIDDRKSKPIKEAEELCLKVYGFYDPNLISLEQSYNAFLHELEYQERETR